MKLLKPLFTITLLLLSSSNALAQKYVGGDISMLTKYEEAGVEYKDNKGNTVTDVLAFFKQEGLNCMRLRLFVDPTKASYEQQREGVCQNLDYVKKLGKRIKDAGMKLMLDFHYSDTWADPAKQWTPDAWKSLSDEELGNKIYNYTKDCLQQMNDADATPDFIQTGNEISFGMLWGTEAEAKDNETNRCYINSPEANWTRFFSLLDKAGKACRETCAGAKIIIHSERSTQPQVLTDFCNRLKSANIDYDIIGLSYYPDFHGSLTSLETTINQLENQNYGKDIMIVETGYSYAWPLGGRTYNYEDTYHYTEEGQQKYAADLVSMLNKHNLVKGLFWWWIEDNGDKDVTTKWWNAALYNHETGQPYAAFYELKQFTTANTAIHGVKEETLSKNNTWFSMNGTRLEGTPSKSGIYIYNNKKIIVQ